MEFNIEELDKYDGILLVEEDINEAKKPPMTTVGGMGAIDPRMQMNPAAAAQDIIIHYSPKGGGVNLKYGNQLRSYLQMSAGYSSEVVDFGDVITIKVTYTNTTTGSSASMNFAVIFTTMSGRCIVKANSQRWRTCNSPDQIASYVRSKASALPGKTSSIS